VNNEVRCVATVANSCGPDTNQQYIYDYALSGGTGFSGDGGPATEATENVPQGLGFDPAGNLYFGGGGDFVVRRVDATTQNIMTVAGNTAHPGDPGFGGDGGPSTASTVYLDNLGLAVNGNEYLLIADNGNNRVRQVDMVPEIAMFEHNLNFGQVQDGTTSPTMYATMQNYGLATLPIYSVAVTPNQQYFQIVSNTCGNQLPPGPASGNDKSTCTVGIQFTPQAPPNSYNATLVINTSLGPQDVNLEGVGIN